MSERELPPKVIVGRCCTCGTITGGVVLDSADDEDLGLLLRGSLESGRTIEIVDGPVSMHGCNCPPQPATRFAASPATAVDPVAKSAAQAKLDRLDMPCAICLRKISDAIGDDWCTACQADEQLHAARAANDELAKSIARMTEDAAMQKRIAESRLAQLTRERTIDDVAKAAKSIATNPELLTELASRLEEPIVDVPVAKDAAPRAEGGDRHRRLESWAAGVCEYLQGRKLESPNEINGAGLWLEIYGSLPSPPLPAAVPCPSNTESFTGTFHGVYPNEVILGDCSAIFHRKQDADDFAATIGRDCQIIPTKITGTVEYEVPDEEPPASASDTHGHAPDCAYIKAETNFATCSCGADQLDPPAGPISVVTGSICEHCKKPIAYAVERASWWRDGRAVYMHAKCYEATQSNFAKAKGEERG